MIDSSGNQVDGSKVIIYAAAVRNSDCATNSIDRSCCIESNNASHLSGILIAPDCDISIGNGTKSRSTVWANRIFTGSDFKNPPDTDACAASDLMGQISCRTSASGPLIPLYQDGSTYSLGSEVTFGGKRYECLNQSKCDTGGWSNFWPGQGPNWPDAWAQFDDCIEMSIPTTPGVGAPRGECPVLIESSEVLRFKNEPCEDSEDCQINSRCTEADTASSCGGHSKCSSGAALSCAGTDACVAAVCAEEPACCASFWGQTNCADRVEEICAVECGAVTPSLCPHDACVIGEALNDSCSEDVEDVCDSLPGCCSGTGPNEWGSKLRR